MKMEFFIIYLFAVNMTAFIMMAVDKRRAKRHAWRIAEAHLFLSAILGGSIGAWAGMYVFHHKTKHVRFVVGMPLILFLQVVLTGILLSR